MIAPSPGMNKVYSEMRIKTTLAITALGASQKILRRKIHHFRLLVSGSASNSTALPLRVSSCLYNFISSATTACVAPRPPGIAVYARAGTAPRRQPSAPAERSEVRRLALGNAIGQAVGLLKVRVAQGDKHVSQFFGVTFRCLKHNDKIDCWHVVLLQEALSWERTRNFGVPTTTAAPALAAPPPHRPRESVPFALAPQSRYPISRPR